MHDALGDARVEDDGGEPIDDRALAHQRGDEDDGREHREVFDAVEMRVMGSDDEGRIIGGLAAGP